MAIDEDDKPLDEVGSARHDPIELVAAILLGLAAVLVAWSTFQSGLWGGRQDEAYTESVREANNAVDQLQAADTIRALDQSLFVEVLTSGVCDPDEPGDPEVCERVLVNMSDEGAAAVEAWLTTEQSAPPFESRAYVEALYAAGEEAKVTSQRFFDEANEANQNGDDFELVVTLLTVVMFFAGISVVIKDTYIRWTLIAVAGIMLVGSSVFMLSLPPA